MPKEKKPKGASKKKEAKKSVAKKPSKKAVKVLKEEKPAQAPEVAQEKVKPAEVKPLPEAKPSAPSTEKPEMKVVPAQGQEEAKKEAVKPRIAPKKEGVHYYSGTGRRKTSVARVRLYQGKGAFIINGRQLSEYVAGRRLLEVAAKRPLVVTGNLENFDVLVNVFGGGVVSQAEAVRHGVARALLEVNQDLKPSLKREGLLTRDPRMKERKKYGRKRARKRFQYSKR
jgi:small subunit ribosomal protein S9